VVAVLFNFLYEYVSPEIHVPWASEGAGVAQSV
jgi:hypothetical protein